MNARAATLHGRLRVIERERAEAQTALIAALNHREIEDVHTTARAPTTRDRHSAAAWIRFDTARGPVMIAPLLVDNQLARMTSGPGVPDGAAAAATLGRIEPLVAAIETILGLELHPSGLGTDVDEDLLLLRLDAHDRTGVRHRLLVATGADIDVLPLPLPADLPARVGGLALRWCLEADLPPIRAARLRALSRGDCIVLGVGPLRGRLVLPGRSGGSPVAVDIKRGNIVLDRDPQQGDPIVSDRISAVETPVSVHPEGAPRWADLKIAATIEVDGGRLTAAQMATLGEGSVLPLPAAGGTLAVRVVAGGATIADGELVAVGEGFGVLVTALHATGDATA